MREEFDVILVGAGPAGLAAAVALADAGARTALVDRIAPAATADDDLRTAALLEPSVDFLSRLGLWPHLELQATPLKTLRIVDAGLQSFGALSRDFDAVDAGCEAFGWNIANSFFKARLLDHVAQTDEITLVAPADILSLARREDAALLTLETPDGRRALRAPLLVGADGKKSAIRAEAGIETQRIDSGHWATVFLATHPEPHQNVSVEIYEEGGPFTLVPHTNDAGQSPRSSIVWMMRAGEMERLWSLGEEAFAAAANARSRGVFGALKPHWSRARWKVESLLARRLFARRVALLGEAAHASPPIGAQGLNMSLTDAAALSELVGNALADGKDLGSPALLQAYEKRRWRDVASRVGAVSALGFAADGGNAALRALRRVGLAAAYDARPIKDALMRTGLGG